MGSYLELNGHRFYLQPQARSADLTDVTYRCTDCNTTLIIPRHSPVRSDRELFVCPSDRTIEGVVAMLRLSLSTVDPRRKRRR
jgi:hypothetical protein